MREKWHEVLNASEVPSPCLLIYPDRVRENIHRMIPIAGGVERLRPHMKTHKMAEVIRMQMEQGITKFKCATIAEAEMTAAAGADDVLLAYEPVGPHFEKPWAIYAIHFTTRKRRQLSAAARQIVLDCVLHWKEQRYRLIVACVMPDHVHLIIQPGIESIAANGAPVFYALSRILHTI